MSAADGLEIFFLCGFGKSGTNWVGNVLNLHPRIVCDGEWQFQHFARAWDEFARHPWQLGSRQPARRVARAGVERLIRDCLATLAEGRDGVRLVGDRSPRPLRELVRGSSTIYVQRDGRDVVVSYTFHHLRAGEAHHFPERLRRTFERHQLEFREDPDAMTPERPGLLGEEAWVRETARFWARRVTRDAETAGGMDPARLLRVRYEDLHRDVEGTAGRMYRFLGVDPAEATPPTRGSRTAAGFAQEDRGSLYRRGESGGWRRWATPAFEGWIREEAGAALARLGYGWESVEPRSAPALGRRVG